MGVPVRPGQPAPNVMIDVLDAAVRAGVGEFGACGLLLTPQFGPRQRFQMVLTDAELEPTPLLAEPVCVHCASLSSVCPLGAISADGVDISICRTCQNGAQPNSLHPAGKPDRLGALCARNCVQALEDAGRLENVFARPFRARAPWGVVVERRGL
jgi:epoxyqueuosine reductase QueG